MASAAKPNKAKVKEPKAKGPKAASSRPNVLLVVTDDQRAAGTMGAMPLTRQVFARRSTRFTRAHASTPLCCPARASLLSGLYAHNHGVWFNQGQIPDQRRTLQNRLRRSGYTTAMVGKYLNSWELGEDPPFWDKFWVNHGAHRGSTWNLNGRIKEFRGHSTGFAARKAKRFIKGADQEDRKPWFLYVAVSEPHGPLRPHRRHQLQGFGGFPHTPATRETDLSDKPAYLQDQAEGFAAASVASPEEVRLAQLRLLQSADELVDSTYRQLRRSGEARDTLVIFTSDHGLHWGEHGGFVLKDLPYAASTHVPLLIRWPARLAKNRPRRDRRLVSNVDLAPTVFDLARVRKTHKTDGRSVRHRGWRREYLLAEYRGLRANGFVIPPWRALRSETELYVEYDAIDEYPAESEYYDLSADQWELHSRPEAAPATLSPALAEAFACRAKTCP